MDQIPQTVTERFDATVGRTCAFRKNQERAAFVEIRDRVPQRSAVARVVAAFDRYKIQKISEEGRLDKLIEKVILRRENSHVARVIAEAVPDQSIVEVTAVVGDDDHVVVIERDIVLPRDLHLHDRAIKPHLQAVQKIAGRPGDPLRNFDAFARQLRESFLRLIAGFFFPAFHVAA